MTEQKYATTLSRGSTKDVSEDVGRAIAGLVNVMAEQGHEPDWPTLKVAQVDNDTYYMLRLSAK